MKNTAVKEKAGLDRLCERPNCFLDKKDGKKREKKRNKKRNCRSKV
jgi:hypothetical protein